MKKVFKPEPLIDLPRWLETIFQCFLFLTIVFLIHLLRLDAIFKGGDIFNIANSKFWTVLFYFILYYLYKLLGTHTAVDLIEFDYSENTIHLEYWLFYFYRKRLVIKFEDLSFKTGFDISIVGGSFLIKIYQKHKLKIKINKRNGWKKKQIKEIYSILKIIKNPRSDRNINERQK